MLIDFLTTIGVIFIAILFIVMMFVMTSYVTIFVLVVFACIRNKINALRHKNDDD